LSNRLGPTSVTGNMRRLALPIYLPSLLSAIAQNAVQILLPLYALKVGGGPAMVAALVGLRGVGTMLSDLPAGLMVAHLGERTVMSIGLTTLFLASIGCALTDSALVLGFLALGFGAGFGIWLLSRLSLITEDIPLEQRGRIISVMAGLQRAGALIGPLLAGFSAETFGYPPVFVASGLLFLLALGLVFIFAKNSDSRNEQSHSIELTGIISQHRKIFATAGMVMIFLSALRHARLLFIPLVGVSIGLDESDIGLAFSLSSAVDMAMFYPAGQMLDRLGRKFALIPSITLLGLSLMLIPYCSSFLSFTAVAMLAGLGNGFGTGIFMTLGSDFSPRVGRGQFLGVWRLVGDMGGATGPFVLGSIAQAASLVLACNVAGGFAGIGLIILILFVPETLRKPIPREI